METRRRKYVEPEPEPDSKGYFPEPAYNLTTNSINSYRILHRQCRELNGKYYIIDINPYKNKQLHSLLPIITNLNELEDGVYVYVLLSLDNSPPEIYLIKTYTSFEIGTKHQQLTHRIACSNNVCKKYKLYYAGELNKTGNEIKFNFYSGTFKMESKIKKNTLPKDIEFMKEYLSNNYSSNESIEFMDEPIITKENIVFTERDLHELKGLGATIYEFDDKETCKKYYPLMVVSANNNTKKRINLTENTRLYGGIKRTRTKTKRKKTRKTKGRRQGK